MRSVDRWHVALHGSSFEEALLAGFDRLRLSRYKRRVSDGPPVHKVRVHAARVGSPPNAALTIAIIGSDYASFQTVRAY